jgi:hypothetical protein
LLGIQILILPGTLHNGPVKLGGQLHIKVSGKTSTQIAPDMHGLSAQIGAPMLIIVFREKYDINIDSFPIIRHLRNISNYPFET